MRGKVADHPNLENFILKSGVTQQSVCHDQHQLRADRLFGDNPPNGRAGSDGGSFGYEIFLGGELI